MSKKNLNTYKNSTIESLEVVLRMRRVIIKSSTKIKKTTYVVTLDDYVICYVYCQFFFNIVILSVLSIYRIKWMSI